MRGSALPATYIKLLHQSLCDKSAASGMSPDQMLERLQIIFGHQATPSDSQLADLAATAVALEATWLERAPLFVVEPAVLDDLEDDTPTCSRAQAGENSSTSLSATGLG